MAERIGPGRLEVLNAGVAGYNSFQGVMLLRTKLRGLEPDLITVRFGWNDHFMSASPDANGYREPDSALALGFQDLMLRTSLYGFFRRLNFELQALRARANPPPASSAADRVDAERPARRLQAQPAADRRLGACAGRRGVAAHLAARLRHRQQPRQARRVPELEAVLAFNGIPSFDRLIEIHDSYNQATREVGAELASR